MRDNDVPQDKGILGNWKEIKYAVDHDGKYVQVPSTGWNPVVEANLLSWREHARELERIRQRVLVDEASPLEFHMRSFQMDSAMLADYTGIYRWRVRRHLKPQIFQKLPRRVLQQYADIWKMSVEEIRQVPADPIELEDFRTTGMVDVD